MARRITLRLRERTVDGLDWLVRRGVASSRNTLVEALVENARRAAFRHDRELDSEKIYAAAFGQAPYAAEQDALTADFASADAETARDIDR